MNPPLRFHPASAALLALLLAGCSSDEFPIVPVSGRVTLHGKPAAQVAVMFQPMARDDAVSAGPGSYGITDEEGKYQLKLVAVGPDRAGAVVGKHKVRFTNYRDPSAEKDDRPAPLPRGTIPVPAKYNQIQAAFEYDVPAAGTPSADFALTR